MSQGVFYYQDGILFIQADKQELDDIQLILPDEEQMFTRFHERDTKPLKRIFDRALEQYVTCTGQEKDANPLWLKILDQVSPKAGFVFWNTAHYKMSDYLQRALFPMPTEVLTAVLFVNSSPQTRVTFERQELYLTGEEGWLVVAPTGLTHYQKWTLDQKESKAIATFYHSDTIPSLLVDDLWTRS
jgi:hypothetical protein